MKKRFAAIAAAMMIVLSLAIPALARQTTGLYNLYTNQHSVTSSRLTSKLGNQSCYNYATSDHGVYSRVFTVDGSSRTKRSEKLWEPGEGGWNTAWQDSDPTKEHIFEGEMNTWGLYTGSRAEAELFTTP